MLEHAANVVSGGGAVGAVEKSKILTGKEVAAGDVVLGLASSGVHSNGFSLVRKCIERAGAQAPATLDGKPFRQAVMEPTRLYVKPVLAALAQHPGIKALAHITGGGFPDNIPRVLPKHLGACIDVARIPVLPVFKWLAAAGGIAEKEMLRTFNCGIGMIAVVDARSAGKVAAILEREGERVVQLGELVAAAKGKPRVTYTGHLNI